MAHCSICTAESPKYKCASCKAQSCSLTCFKTHAAQCKADRESSTAILTEAAPEQIAKKQYPSPAELTSLFTRYPTLRAQLQDLYKTTQRPDENSIRGGFNNRGRGRGSFPNDGDAARNWTPEKGFDRGLKQLQRALEHTQDLGRSEALQMFVDMVLQRSLKAIGEVQPQEDTQVTRP